MVHSIRHFYAAFYASGSKLGKRDKVGIHSQIEKLTISIFSKIFAAVFSPRDLKKPILSEMRIEIEVAKQLVRAEHELHIIDQKTYIRLQENLQEISRMTNGWIRSLP